MLKLPAYDWFWVVWVAYFVVIEGYGIWHEIKYHGDDLTFTHFASVLIPIGIRAGFIAWLAFHFLVQHKTS